MKKKIILTLLAGVLFSYTGYSQYTTPNGICELPTFQDWSAGAGANPCACTWCVPSTGYILCSYGNCGQAEILECAYDCNSYTWHQGGGNYGFNICNTVLGVELISIKGVPQGRNIEVVWESIEDNRSDYYELYHSTDGKSFERLVTIKSIGKEKLSTYQFIHNKASIGDHYYRLHEVNTNGESSELALISVSNVGVGANKIFGDPMYDYSNQRLKMYYFGKFYNVPVSISVLSMDGKENIKENVLVSDNCVEVNFDKLRNGMYIIQIVQGENVELKKIQISN